MIGALSSSLGGLSAAMSGLHVAAHNIAAASVPGSPRLRAEAATTAVGGVQTTVAAAGPAGLETDVVALLQAKNAFLANLAVFRRADEALASLVDLRG